jgi:hypothetical protein
MKEERKAYILGVLAACQAYSATHEVTAQVMVDLGVTPDELRALDKAGDVEERVAVSDYSGVRLG